MVTHLLQQRINELGASRQKRATEYRDGGGKRGLVASRRDEVGIDAGA